MRNNMSSSERWVRAVVGLFAVLLGTISAAGAGWSTAAWVLGGVLVLTGVAGYCPVYDLLGYSSAEIDGHDRSGHDDRWGSHGS